MNPPKSPEVDSEIKSIEKLTGIALSLAAQLSAVNTALER